MFKTMLLNVSLMGCSSVPYVMINVFFKDFIYLLLERGERREGEREGNISVWLPLMQPLLGTRLKPRHVP